MPRPQLQALLLADHVYQDAGSNKFVICGVFSTLHAQRPTGKNKLQQADDEKQAVSISISDLMQAGSPWAYVSLTEVHGEKSFELRYVSLDDNLAIFSTRFKVQSNDPVQTIQFRIALPILPTPHLGVFALELLCEDEILGSHRVTVVGPESQPEDESDN